MKSNRVKKFCISLAISILMVLLLGQSMIYATLAEPGKELYARISDFRWVYSVTEDKYVEKWGYGLNSGDNYPIYQIIRNDRQDSDTIIATNLYCLNAIYGDTWQEGVKQQVKFNEYYDLKDRETIRKAQQGNKVYNLADYEYYNAVIWLLDNFYIPSKEHGEEQNEQDRAEFLSKVGIIKKDIGITIDGQKYEPYTYDGKYNFANIGVNKGYWYKDTSGKIQDVLLPDEIIESVQQAAIWYFTNYKEEGNRPTNNPEKYDLYFESENSMDWPDWLIYKEDELSEYKSLDNYKINEAEVGGMYREQAALLYNYLVDKGLEAQESGYTGEQEKASISLKHGGNALTKEESGYKVGPLTVEAQGIVSNIQIKVQDGEGNDITENCTIPETIIAGQQFYITNIPISTNGNIKVIAEANGYGTKQTLWVSSDSNEEQPLAEIERGQVAVDPVELTFRDVFDLALRKVITEVENANGTKISIKNENGFDATRKITVNTDTIPDTATYKHRKDPVVVSTGDIVTYQIKIYNEGNIDGYASIIVDQLPTGLTSTLKVGDTVTSSKGNIYEVKSYNDNKLVLEISSITPTSIKANNGTLDSDTIELECKVEQKSSRDSKTKHYLTNIAYINEAKDSAGTVQVQDREDTESKPSEYPEYSADELNNTEVKYEGNEDNQSIYSDTNNEYYYKGQEDDDDFETVVILPEEFDLKLIKYISAVNGTPSNRKITVDTSNLNKTVNNKKITTADYDVSKVPITVETGDIVTYTFRIYNEGDIDGYASEITEDIPQGLEFMYSTLTTDEEIDADPNLTTQEKEAIKFNREYLWVYDSSDTTQRTIKTDYLSKDVSEDNLIEAFDPVKGLSYKEVSVMFKVTSTDVKNVIRNEAEISDDTDENGDKIDDRDSDTENWEKKDSDDNYENDPNYPKYEEDDEDYDNIKLVRFDLALRKFIAAISSDATISDGEYLTTDKTSKTAYTRAPKVDTSKLKTGEDLTAIYNHPKDPITVNNGDYVLYTIRVYNEGELDGYAASVKDYLPEYLNYIDGEFNKNFGWVYNQEDRSVTTDYLSSEKGKGNILKAFDNQNDDGSGSGLSYKDVQILCRVSTDVKTEQNITNIAEITQYQDENGNNKNEDVDSRPGNLNYPEDVPGYEGNPNGDNKSDTYYPGQEDDDDFERIKVQEFEFDLSLLKYVSQVIVTENGTTTTTETGNKGDDKDIIPKVEIHRKNLESTSVKFVYTIKITNEGDIEGYAKEITDYVPEGLEFYAEDNKGWEEKEDGVITTNLLSDTLLKPGESAQVKVTFRWKKGENNLGLKTNIAEISEDYNERGIPDRDSTPGNKKDGEDDIDDAEVLLSIKTGLTENIITYVSGAAIILIVLAGGVILIKKFVL